MISLAMMRKAEGRLRQLLCEDNVAQPDEVEYRPGVIALFWHSVHKAIEVEVTDQGEVGKSRLGRWRPPHVAVPHSHSNGNRIIRLHEKRAAEQNARAMLEDHGLPQPDEVEYGYHCIRLLWNEEKFALVIDLDDPPLDEDEGEDPDDPEEEAA